jgi:hypothetical protein
MKLFGWGAEHKTSFLLVGWGVVRSTFLVDWIIPGALGLGTKPKLAA